MRDSHRLSDSDHRLVVATAMRLTESTETALEKLESLFLFVRDRIPFGLPSTRREWDNVKASRIITAGYGYCNTKATLLVALCRASGIPARVHFGLIDAAVMRGIFPTLALPFLPKAGSHSWTEVEIGGAWKPIDSYINDELLFRAARIRLKKSGRRLGYSLAGSAGRCSCEFNFGDKGFVQMGGVVEDHGVWEDSSDYFASDKYVVFGRLQSRFYPLVAALSNRNIRRLRGSVPWTA